MKSAVELADASFEKVMAKDKQGWVELFTEDALVRDPVGVTGHDPEGEGFKGKSRIGILWDRTIAPVDIRFVVRERYEGGNEAATLFTAYLTPPGGETVPINGMAIHESDGNGRMKAMSSYLIPAGTRYPAG